jgi:hypothetical protein
MELGNDVLIHKIVRRIGAIKHDRFDATAQIIEMKH